MVVVVHSEQFRLELPRLTISLTSNGFLRKTISLQLQQTTARISYLPTVYRNTNSVDRLDVFMQMLSFFNKYCSRMCPGWFSGDCNDDESCCNTKYYYIKGQRVHIVPVILDPSQDSLEKQQYYQDLHNVKMSMSRPNTPMSRPNTPVNRFR